MDGWFSPWLRSPTRPGHPAHLRLLPHTGPARPPYARAARRRRAYAAALSARERRRDLGMLKSIGMTPRQVTVMMVVSMAGLGLVGGVLGLPLGVAAYRVVIPRTEHSAQLTFPARMLDVWHSWTTALPALAGVAIAALGAVIPARAAARQTIARALRTE
ncbi:FtsX-like permease family protein [Streptomyces sp. NPDC001450]